MLPDGWRYRGVGRDPRLDMLRGYCMAAMVIDHIGAHTGATGSWLYAFTGGNQFFVSAAEGFIFISGLITGVINGGVTAGHGLGRVVMRILHRGWLLYGVTVFLTFAFALVLLGLRYPGAPHMETKEIPAWVIGVLTLHRTYYLTDVIFTYALLFFAAGLAVTLIGHGYTRWVLIGSWAIWLLWQFFPREAEVPWAVVDGGAFHFSAWQALFFTALIIGYHRRAMGAWLSWVRPEAVLMVSAILLLACLGLYWTRLRPLAALLPGIGQAQLSLQFLDKADLRAGRLLAFAVVGAFAWSVTTLAWAPVRRAFGWLMLPLGQRSLTAYSVHVFVVAVLGWVTVNLWPVAPRSIGANTMVQVLGLAMVWAAVLAAPRLISLAHRWDELEHRLLAEVEHVLTLNMPHY
jgi:hypothetical protein